MLSLGVISSFLTSCFENNNGGCGGFTGNEIILVLEEAQELTTKYWNREVI